MSLRDLLNKQKPAAAQPAPIPAIPPEARQQEVVAQEIVKSPEVKRSALSRLAPATVKAFPQCDIPAVAISTPKETPPTPVAILPTPTGPTLELTKLRQNLDYLANNIEQRELVGQVVRTIAVQLKTHPELDKFLENADYNLIIRGLRSAFAIAARAKSEKREVRAQKSEIENELADMMKDMGMKLS